MIKRAKKKSNNYFTEETEAAIIYYNDETNSVKKNKVYGEKIHYPIFKLTQNIIHTFKFYNTEVDDLEHLQHELEIFVLSKLDKFSPAKSVEDKILKLYKSIKLEFNHIGFQEYLANEGLLHTTFHLSDIKAYFKLISPPEELMEELLKINIPKAYSYFGTIVKRWLILYDQNNYKKKINSIPIQINSNDDDSNSDYNVDLVAEPEYAKDKLEIFIDKYVEFCTENIKTLFPKTSEAQIADAILELFRNRNNIDIFNKKALYMYIREIVDAKTPKITKIANQLYDIFKGNYAFYLEYDYIKFKL